MSQLTQTSLVLSLLLLFGVWGCTPKQAEKGSAPIPVQVFEVKPASITRTLQYDADLKGELEVKVFSQVPERILSKRVEAGDPVKRGQILAVVRADALSDSVQSAAAAIDAARADRDNLKDELARQTKLLSRKIVSQAVVDQLAARLRSGEAQIRRLEAMERQASTARGNAVVRSPIRGVVGQCLLEQGDMALPTIPICTIVQLDRVELLLDVPEQDLGSIRPEMAAHLRVARYPGETFEGTVARIYPTIDRRTRTAQVKVVLQNKDRRLMPGMLVRVKLEVERRDNVAVVPYNSLIIEMGGGGKVTHRAFVLDPAHNTVSERVLRLGLVDGKRVQVESGLSFGDQLVTQGQHLLRPGRAARVVERLNPDGKTVKSVAREAGAGGAAGTSKTATP